MREALRTSARLGLLAALLLVQPAASGDLPPAPAGAPGEAEVESADPCAVGRALARMAPCPAGDEDCAAARLWERRFGPSRPTPAAPERPVEATADAADRDEAARGVRARWGRAAFKDEAVLRLAVPGGPVRYPPPPSAVCLADPAAAAAGASPSDR